MSVIELKPLDRSELEAVKGDRDFAEVFGEPDTMYGRTYPASNDPIGFTRSDIQELYAVQYGERDGDPWYCLGRLLDGRYFSAYGWCDYTGWDCQSYNAGQTWDDLGSFIREVGDEYRAAMGVSVDDLGSSILSLDPASANG